MSEFVKGTVFKSEDPKVEKLLDDAATKIDKGDTSGACDIYKSILMFEPDNINAKLGQAYAVAKASFVDEDHNMFNVIQEAMNAYAKVYVDEGYFNYGMSWIKISHKILSKEIGEYKVRCKEIYDMVRDAGYVSSDIDNQSRNTIITVVGQLYTWAAKLGTFRKMYLNINAAFLENIKELARLDIKEYSKMEEMCRSLKGSLLGSELQFVLQRLSNIMRSDAYQAASGIISLISRIDADTDQFININIAEGVAACKDAAREKYWAEHAEEKAALEAKMAELEAEIETKHKACENATAEVRARIKEKDGELAAAEDRANADNRAAQEKIAECEKEKKSIGFFKFKEKKAAQAKIDEAYSEAERISRAGLDAVDAIKAQRTTLNKRVKSLESEFRSAKAALQKEINKVKAEFTKDR